MDFHIKLKRQGIELSVPSITMLGNCHGNLRKFEIPILGVKLKSAFEMRNSWFKVKGLFC